MIGGSTPEALAARFTAVTHQWVSEGPAERTERARRKLLSAIVDKEPATLNEVAKSIGRGAPAVSRSVDVLVRSGLVERTQDPNNRRRLALRRGHFAGPEILDDQLRTLEEPADALVLDAARPVDDLVREISVALAA